MDNVLDAFAPLSEAEIAEGARQGPQFQHEPDAKPICPPFDAESVESAAIRLYGHRPDGLWRYATAKDETAFYAARWNESDGKKTYRPVSWLEGDGWQFTAWPHDRHLYG